MCTLFFLKKDRDLPKKQAPKYIIKTKEKYTKKRGDIDPHQKISKT
jgi:hypothetical protein